MKKYILSLAALCLTSAASAQILDFEGMPPYKLGVTAGINVPSFSAGSYDYTVGLQAGIDLMVDASDLLELSHLRAQLKYSMKGATGPDPKYSNTAVDTKVYYTTHYLELPIHYGYSWTLTDEWTVLAETGPYFAIGLAGIGREHGDLLHESHSFYKHYDASRFDFGWGIQGGLLFTQTLMLNISYDWGFKNISPSFLQNTNFAVGLTYFIE